MQQPRTYLAEVQFYGSRTCGWSMMAERLLIEKGVSYQREDVGGNPARRKFVRDLTGRTSVPQIIINGRAIGGYTDLAALESTGRLDEMLARPPALGPGPGPR
jgi:glutaredoxin 3